MLQTRYYFRLHTCTCLLSLVNCVAINQCTACPLYAHILSFTCLVLTTTNFDFLIHFQVIQMNIEEPARKAIAQELKINQSSQCPYVVMCYQSFYNNGAISIILEYMDGGSLADFLKKVKTIPEPYLAAIFKQVTNVENHTTHEFLCYAIYFPFFCLLMQVLKGLLYLHHEKHIIHRDLKPSNLLINHTGEVKITDFGVSAIMASTSGQANTFVGTYNYMSVSNLIINVVLIPIFFFYISLPTFLWQENATIILPIFETCKLFICGHVL